MLADADNEVATMGWNLLHDGRIASARFEEFEHTTSAFLPAITSPSLLQDAINHYCDSRVHFSSSPDFLSAHLNLSNFHGEHDPLPALHGSKLLTRVLNLGRLGPVFTRAKHDGVLEFADYGASPIVQWLDTRLMDFGLPSTGPDRDRLHQDTFLLVLLDYLNTFRKANPFQPVWATLWSEFIELDHKSPERWTALLGVRPSPTPTWLLLLRYPVRQAGKLVRPTQLDAGWYPEHSPVPPSARTGHPMELDATQPQRFLLPEYIHQQIDHFPNHLVGCARVGGTPKRDLRPPQIRHLGMLRARYADAAAWSHHKHPAFP
ncbi:MAG: hypothetical protein IT577_19315 [Verrucomicrobiae bacterium]|nr:hypothetical protein [Verrucomicrobiae bacterium]